MIIASGPGMLPMRVTARMERPVIYYGDLIHLDALVAAGFWYALSGEQRQYFPDVQGSDAVDFDLPLARWYASVEQASGDIGTVVGIDVGVQQVAVTRTPAFPRWVDDDSPLIGPLAWGWCASAEVSAWSAISVHRQVKRQPIEEFAEYTTASSVSTSAGPLKAHQLAFTEHHGDPVWHAFGYVDAVRELLGHVRRIGKKRGTGHGQVLEWLVEPWPEDLSLARDGFATRRMPVGSGLLGYAGDGGIRTPYYHPSRHCLATVAPAPAYVGELEA